MDNQVNHENANPEGGSMKNTIIELLKKLLGWGKHKNVPNLSEEPLVLSAKNVDAADVVMPIGYESMSELLDKEVPEALRNLESRSASRVAPIRSHGESEVCFEPAPSGRVLAEKHRSHAAQVAAEVINNLTPHVDIVVDSGRPFSTWFTKAAQEEREKQVVKKVEAEIVALWNESVKSPMAAFECLAELVARLRESGLEEFPKALEENAFSDDEVVAFMDNLVEGGLKVWVPHNEVVSQPPSPLLVSGHHSALNPFAVQPPRPKDMIDMLKESVMSQNQHPFEHPVDLDDDFHHRLALEMDFEGDVLTKYPVYEMRHPELRPLPEGTHMEIKELEGEGTVEEQGQGENDDPTANNDAISVNVYDELMAAAWLWKRDIEKFDPVQERVENLEENLQEARDQDPVQKNALMVKMVQHAHFFETVGKMILRGEWDSLDRITGIGYNVGHDIGKRLATVSIGRVRVTIDLKEIQL